jgi:hypothetical protein
MKLPEGYTYKASCGESKGKRDVIDEAICWGQDAESLQRSQCKNWQLPNEVWSAEVGAMVDWPGYETEYECQQDILVNGISKAPRAPYADPPATDYKQEPRQCDFENQRYTKNGWDIPWDRCMLEAREGYAYNIYMCKDQYGNNMTCANNCRGVNPNAVIVGGVGVLAAAVASQQVLLQAAGLGAIGLGAIGVGGASALMNINRCPNTRPCRGRDRGNPRRRKCCRLFGTGQGARCPRFC